jgi:hypothetical protein
MALTTEQKSFIESVASAVKAAMGTYNIKVASPVIAQAIIESGWGKSQLAAKYHNYFGLKCGSSWKGKSVNMSTKEEYTAGTLTTIKDNFRVFDSLEDGIKGYFDFINTSRYSNLKGVTDPETYVKNIKADGYATSSTYVTTIMNCIKSYNLTQYDGASVADAKKSVSEVAQEVLAGKWGNGAERKDAITKAGYDYAAVQAEVNKLSGKTTTSAFVPYDVKVTISDLRIRKGPGTNYAKNGYIAPGVYTISQESAGKGATKWGKLKSGKGWISLDYVNKV